MKLRTRITLLFTIITASIVMIFGISIYLVAKENRQKEFYTLLEKEAITKINLFLDAEVDTKTLQNIYRSNREILNEVEVAIYNESFELIYHDAVDIDFVKETPEMLEEIVANERISFYQEDWQVIGLLYAYGDQKYIVTAAAYDEYGYTKLASLLYTLLLAFGISIVVIFVSGLYISKQAFDPLKDMSEKAKIISATNLDLRLNTSDSQDELSELAITFNEMLNRLETSFDAQKDFVSNISHELRTPLASIVTELELALDTQSEKTDYHEVISNTLSDAKKLVRLSNSLLDFAKASYDPSEISFKNLRMDELLMDARQDLLHHNPNFTIDIQFDMKWLSDSNDDQISVNGNEYLLQVALTNLLENGCKYSKDNTCKVTISGEKSVEKQNIVIKVQDFGIGIRKKDLPHIFTPFYRGKNQNFVDGNGIGMSLTKKIIDLHQGEINVKSKVNKGTTFTVKLPSL